MHCAARGQRRLVPRLDRLRFAQSQRGALRCICAGLERERVQFQQRERRRKINFAEAVRAQGAQQRIAAESGLVRVEILAAGLDLRRVAVDHVVRGDRADVGLVDFLLDIQFVPGEQLDQFAYVRHPDFGEALGVKHMQKPLQHLVHVVPVIMLEVVRAIDGVESVRAGGLAQRARIAHQVRTHPRIDVQQQLLPLPEMRRQRDPLLPPPTLSTRLTAPLASARRANRSFKVAIIARGWRRSWRSRGD